jgi:uncharacterized membrane protein
MAATITQTRSFTATESVTAAKLNDIASTSTISGIVNAEIDANAAIVDTKLATITTAGKVNITALVASSQATGDLIYYSGSAWVRLAVGSVGQTLTVSGGNPVWVT